MTSVLKAFVNRLISSRPDGRPLDITDPTTHLQGMTSPISVDREDILSSTFYELMSADGRDYDPFDVRLPLEVSFYGEGQLKLASFAYNL